MSEPIRPAPTAAPRRRYLTILFSDLSDSTGIASRLEAEDYSDLLARLREVYHRVVADHGGTITQISGDGMLAIFGYPEASEVDGRRATEAALALHDRVASLDGGESLQLHSGIHSGLVLLDEGDEVRGRFELLGSATNIASRLCGLAQPGQILVSEATLGPERHLFEASGRSYLNLKGKEEPVATLTISGRAAARSRYAASVRAGLTPFVGRQTELDRLITGLDEALAGGSRFIEIEGPAGVGKTRLAEELLGVAIARGCRVCRGECDAAAEPLQPFLQIARSIFGIDRPMPPDEAIRQVEASLVEIDPGLNEHLPALARLLSLERDRPPAGEDNVAAMRAVLEGLGRREPLALFVDDWHLADDASREMLAALGDLGRPLFALLTARPEGGDGRMADFDILPLAPFSPDETAEAVARLLPSPDPFVVAEIGESSGGNALFIEELCHSIADGRRGEGPHGGSPWLDILIESRFSRLPDPQKQLVRKAAVIGTVIPAWLLEAITGHGERDPLVGDLAEQDFIFSGEREGTLRFKHGLARDAIYHSVGLHERRALHLEIAAALRSRGREFGEEEPHEALAYHYGAGEDWEATAHHAELAGDRALAASALDRAQAQYKAALAALDRLPTSNEITYRWGRIAQRFGRAGVFDPSRDQLAVFERAVEIALLRGDEAAFAWAQYWLGYIYYGLGEPDAAIRHWQRALEAATAVSDARLVVETRMALGQGHAAACDYEAALPLLDEAIQVKRRHRSPNRAPITLAYSLSCKAFALGDMGRFAEAYACFEEAMEAISGIRHEGEVSVLNHYAVVRLWHGQPEEAARLAGEGAKVAERVRSHYSHAMSRAIIAYSSWLILPDPEAVTSLSEATAWLEARDRGQYRSLNHGWLAEVMVAGGRVAEARAHAARALTRARKRDRLGEAMAMRAMARASAALGWGNDADRYIERALEAAAARRSPHELAASRLCQGEIALAAGDQPLAEAALGEAILGFAELRMDRQLERVTELARGDIRPNR